MRKILNWVIPVVAGLLIGLVINSFLGTARVSGNSMQPNLENNQEVILNKHGNVERGSVVVFNAYQVDPEVTQSDKQFVKRVIGVPGDTVSDINGVLRVNGKVVNQSFISENEQVATNYRVGNWSSLKQLGESQNWQGPISDKVPAGYYFVLGDHRSVSNDSRYWGFVPESKICGVVWAPSFDSDSARINDVEF